MNRLDPSDEDLVRDCRNGSSKAWEALTAKHGKAIYGAIFATLARYGRERRADVADDVYQQVLTELFEKDKLSALRDPKLLRPFLASAGVTRTIDALRRLGRAGRREASEDGVETRADEASGPDEAARRAEIAALLEAELNALPSKEAYMLRLALEHDLTHAQIGELMDIPRDTVSTVIRRAKEKVREALKRKGISEI